MKFRCRSLDYDQLVHGIRYLLVAKQLVEFNGFKEVDFTVANEYYESIMQVNDSAEDLRLCKIQYMYGRLFFNDGLNSGRKLKSQLFQSIFGAEFHSANGSNAENEEKWWRQRSEDHGHDNESSVLGSQIFPLLDAHIGIIERKDKILLIDCLRYVPGFID